MSDVAQLPWAADHGIQYDASGHYWCGLCTVAMSTENSWQQVVVKLIGCCEEDVVDHLSSYEHLSVLEVHVLQVTEFLPVVINQTPMLLDNSCIFPSTMFGQGCTVYDETLGMLLAVGACGALRLFAHHRYQITRLLIPDHSTDNDDFAAHLQLNWLIARDQRPAPRGVMGSAAAPLGPSQQRLVRFRIAALREMGFRAKRRLPRKVSRGK